MATIDLKKYGFQKDENAPKSVNRLAKDDKRNGFYASITLDDKGETILYGFVSWYTMDGTDDLIEKRKIKSHLSVEQLEKVLNKHTPENEIPHNVIIYPLSTMERLQRLYNCPIPEPQWFKD